MKSKLLNDSPQKTYHDGHVLSAKVFPTLEVILTEAPAYLRRQPDEETGLALISLNDPL